jgi:antitoxin MazE
LKLAHRRCIIIVDTFYNSFLEGRCTMQTKIKKWGNSLALRIPKLLASDANLKLNKWVNLSIDKESIIITPIGEKEYLLEKLLEGISENNLHGEFDTGTPVGKEIW